MQSTTVRGLDARINMASSRIRRFTNQVEASDLMHVAIALAGRTGTTDFAAGRFDMPCFFAAEPLLSEAWTRAQDVAFLTYRPTICESRGLEIRVRLAQVRVLRLVDSIAADIAEGELCAAVVDFAFRDEQPDVPTLFAGEALLVRAWKYGKHEAIVFAAMSDLF